MSVTLDYLIKTIDSEYSHLCKELLLNKGTLDIYLFEDGSDSLTDFGTHRSNGAALWVPSERKIVLPYTENDLSNFADQTLEFPPTSWSAAIPTMEGDLWPIWRRELWHEVCHQVSSDHGHGWDPREPATASNLAWGRGHGAAWDRAVSYVELVFGVAGDLRAVL